MICSLWPAEIFEGYGQEHVGFATLRPVNEDIASAMRNGIFTTSREFTQAVSGKPQGLAPNASLSATPRQHLLATLSPIVRCPPHAHRHASRPSRQRSRRDTVMASVPSLAIPSWLPFYRSPPSTPSTSCAMNAIWSSSPEFRMCSWYHR